MTDSAHNAEPTPVPERIREWLGRAVADGASDLHLIVGYPPVLRLHGDLTALDVPPVARGEAQALLRSFCPREAFLRLEAQKNVDFSLTLEIGGEPTRFRANVFCAGG